MSINAIAPIGSLAPVLGISPITPATGTSAVGGSGGSDFGAMINQGLQNLQNVQNKADNLAVEAATGQLTDVHDYVIAATQANLATSLTVAVRNKALDAFNEIMRMQA